jgi:hypothetical protein
MKCLSLLFCYFTLSCFSAGSIGYFFLILIMPKGWVFGALYRMFLYHWEHPYQYISLVAVIYGLVAASFALALRHRNKISGWIIFFVMFLTIAIASPAGGLLWVFHDMQAGYFTEGQRFWADLGWGALEGLKSGWLVILLSIPYNLFGLEAGYFVTLYGFRLARPTCKPGPPLLSLSELGVHLIDGVSGNKAQPGTNNTPNKTVEATPLRSVPHL